MKKKDFKIPFTDAELAELSSSELEKISAVLTATKDELMRDYASAQQMVQRHIGPAQMRELDERNKDPEHAAKHQGVGFDSKRS